MNLNPKHATARAWITAASMWLAHCGQSVRLEIPGPRLRWPLSTARVATSRPTLRWFDDAPPIRAHDVHLCRDRAMTRECRVARLIEGETALTVAEPLAAGRWFWTVTVRGERVHRRDTVWQFTARPSVVEQSRSWNARPDFDNDGFDDVSVLTIDSQDAGALLVFGALSIAATRQQTVSLPPGWRFAPFDARYRPLRGPHDVDGDGRTDLVFAVEQAQPERLPDGRTPTARRAFLVLHSRSAFDPSGAALFELRGDGASSAMTPVGDLDGDGFADVVVDSWDGSRFDACFGAQDGLDPRRCTAVSLPTAAIPQSFAGIGDGGDEFVLQTIDGVLARARVP